MQNRRLHSSFCIHSSAIREAFTLLELLVVVGIIGVLAAILFPAVNKVREQARDTDNKALVNQLEGAIQSYYQDHRAYPGPLSGIYLTLQNQNGNDQGIYPKGGGSAINEGTVDPNGVIGADGGRVTGSENLVLGLLGGISLNRTTGNVELDPVLVGQGARSFNLVRPGKTEPYLATANISAGKFVDGTTPNPAKDTTIPEFVDRFPSPMPILYLRARQGGKMQGAAATVTNINNNVVVNVPAGETGFDKGQYNLIEITPYTQSSIGSNPELGVPRGMTAKDYRGVEFKADLPHGLTTVDVNDGMNAKTQYPYLSAFTYLSDPTSYDPSLARTDAQRVQSKKQARKRDAYILICAGRDRVYGTNDDLTNFGSVLP